MKMSCKKFDFQPLCNVLYYHLYARYFDEFHTAGVLHVYAINRYPVGFDWSAGSDSQWHQQADSVMPIEKLTVCGMVDFGCRLVSCRLPGNSET